MSAPKLLQQLSVALKARRYSPRTEESYRAWVRRFVQFHEMRHPVDLDVQHVNAFLTHLAVDRGHSASTQSQARAALKFLYREVLHQPLRDQGPGSIVRGKNPKKVPAVLSRTQVGRLLRQIGGTQRLVASLLYGSGLRISEALSVRVKDVDLEQHRLAVTGGKGRRQRVAVLPVALVQDLGDQLHRRRALHDRDLARGVGFAALPQSFARKSPDAAREFGWQFLFPGTTLPRDPRTGRRGRHHLHPTAVQRAVKRAARSLGLSQRVTCHTLRHSFATHLLADGYDIRTIQELLGHKSVQTTMVYTHVLNRDGRGIRSPLDTIFPP